MQLNLETDINIARKLLYGQPLNMEERKYYGKIYPFSNESLNCYYNYYDMDAKDFKNYTNKKYDAIYLSNILEREWNDYDKSLLLNSYIELLNKNGVLYDYYICRGYIPPYAEKETLENKIGNRILIYRNSKK